MSPSTRNQLIGILLVLLVAGGAYYFFLKKHTSSATPTSATSTITLTPSTSVAASTTPNSGAYTINAMPVSNVPTSTAPDYKSPIVCAASVSTTECSYLQSQDATIIAKLNTNKTDFISWINLGTFKKEAGDYAGAIAAWNYVAKLYPTNPAAYANLADLYMNFSKNYAKAESNYLTVIKLLPSDTGSYTNLFTLYTTTSYRGSAGAAENILKQGIAANPKAVDLQVLLARYYKSQGRTADAKAEFAAAISNAQSQNLQTLATQIQQEAIQ